MFMRILLLTCKDMCERPPDGYLSGFDEMIGNEVLITRSLDFYIELEARPNTV
jgi:hypothetical protein